MKQAIGEGKQDTYTNILLVCSGRRSEASLAWFPESCSATVSSRVGAEQQMILSHMRTIHSLVIPIPSNSRSSTIFNAVQVNTVDARVLSSSPQLRLLRWTRKVEVDRKPMGCGVS